MLHLHHGKMLFSIRAANEYLWFAMVYSRKEVLKPWFQRAFLHTFVARDKSMPPEAPHL